MKLQQCFAPENIVLSVPRNHLMTETEWRNLGVQQATTGNIALLSSFVV